MRLKKLIFIVVLVTTSILFWGCRKYDNPEYKGTTEFQYEDSPDGVIKYFDVDSFREVVYDDLTDQLVVLRSKQLDVYDATTMELKRRINPNLIPTDIDADNGILVVAYNSDYINVYDLTQDKRPNNISTISGVDEIVIDNDMVIFADSDNSSSIEFYNLKTDERLTSERYYHPRLTINRKDHILYVVENSLLYLETRTGELLYRSQNSQFDISNNRIRVEFDGKYIHLDGKTIDRLNGNIISSSTLNQMYNTFSDFRPLQTIYDSEEIAFISDFQSSTVGIYDNINNTFIYDFYICSDLIIKLNDGKYLIGSINKEILGKVDIELITEDLIDDKPIENSKYSVNVSQDEKLKTLEVSHYLDAIVDGNYLFVLSFDDFELNVYNVITLERVYSERFTIKPVSIDADSGKLVIGYGDTYQFRIYDTGSWEYDTIFLDQPVYSTFIYNDTIIYSYIGERCQIKVYNMTTKTHSDLGFLGWDVMMEINRGDGIIYIIDRLLTLNYFDLDSRQKIFSRSISNGSEVHFDGSFVHNGGITYDKVTGDIISSTDMSRLYSNVYLKDIKTIFDNGEISIFTGDNNGETVTVVYDLVTDKELYTLTGGATHAYLVGDIIVILNNKHNIIKTLKL